MYYPIQIPYVLSRPFSEAVAYSEEAAPSLRDFVICFWEMRPRGERAAAVENVIVTDGCIDLVADFDGKQIGFAGMSKTDFQYTIRMPGRFMGARLKPGAFYQLTGLPAARAMDTFLPLISVDKAFDAKGFFALSFDGAKERFKEYIAGLARNKTPDPFTSLFDRLSGEPPCTAEELCRELHFSLRQCQRLFLRRFGLTPKTALCILRFQRHLASLLPDKPDRGEAAGAASRADRYGDSYYDQAHMIKDFKRHIGLTPMELVRRYSD
ncbi:hypothetical protein FACS1894211_12200 [Clostridia bacterium]|nr:hypothetical protein FACS1894211_12200 [Clostridia bacterium]